MSIQTELTRITNAKAAIKTAIEGKGITVPAGTLLDGMAALIESIEASGGAIYTGSITPSAAKEARLSVTHNLGVIPNFAAMYTLDDDTSVTDHAYLRVRAVFCSDVNDNKTICGSSTFRAKDKTSYASTSYRVDDTKFTGNSYGPGQIVYRATESTIEFTEYAGSATVYLQAGINYNILVAKL